MATSLFASPLGVPVFRAYDANGDPLAGGLLYTYEAGTSTPLATYPTYTDALAGTNANANPVVLSAEGSAQVWVQASFYKFALKTSGGTTLYTQDNVGAALAAPSPAVSEWVPSSDASVYVSATSFNVTGVDATGIFHAGRRVRSQNTSGTVYSTVQSSAFTADTLVVVANDGATALDAGFASPAYGIISRANSSLFLPMTVFSGTKTSDTTGYGSVTTVAGLTVGIDESAEWDAANSKLTFQRAGNYLVMGSAEISDTSSSVSVVLAIYYNGSAVAQATGRTSVTATQIGSHHVHALVAGAKGSSVRLALTGSAATTAKGSVGTRFTVVRIM